MDNKEILLQQANDIAYDYLCQDREDTKFCCYLNKDYVENVGISKHNLTKLFKEIVKALYIKYNVKVDIKGDYTLDNWLHIFIIEANNKNTDLNVIHKFCHLNDIYIKDGIVLEENCVFLGGTCENSGWRDRFPKNSFLDRFFNPVVSNWNIEHQLNELEEKALSNIHFYHINSEMAGIYSIVAEIIESCFVAKKVVIYINFDGFSEGQKRALKAVENMAQNHGAIICDSFDDAVSKIIEAI